MGNLRFIFVLLLSTAAVFAAPAIAIIDFDGGSYQTAQKAAVMTGLFRNELVRSGRASIVDRRNMDRIIAEMQFQMSDWADPSKIKQIGRMIGADFLIVGNFDMLGDKMYLIAQMLDIETARVVHSSRLVLETWDEYDHKVKGFAEEFTRKIPTQNIFSGTWSSDIMHDGIIDSYSITFTGTNRVNINLTSMLSEGTLSAEAQGTFNFDGNILRINAIFRNSKIPHIHTIKWTSVVSIASGNQSFNMLVKPSEDNDRLVRATFTRE